MGLYDLFESQQSYFNFSLKNQEGEKKTFAEIHLFPNIPPFWFFEKTELHKIHVSGTVLMIQLMGYSPTNGYIKSVYVETMLFGD